MNTSGAVGSATFDAGGIAQATITPEGAWTTWYVTRITVVTTSVLDTEARIYWDAVTDATLKEGTYSGNRDTCPCNYPLNPGQTLIARWTGGTPNATATVSIDYAFQ